MAKLVGLVQATLMILLSAVAAGQSPSDAPAKPAPRPLYTYRAEMVPMRDGVHLQTVIMVPLDARGPLPILLRRTPYGVPEKAYTEIPESLTALAADGYILVVQNIRGRFKSEGVFSLSEDVKLEPGKGTIETRDAWDSIDWLVKNVPESNGRVGMIGSSYDGFTTLMGLINPHPALKAAVPQVRGAPAQLRFRVCGARGGRQECQHQFRVRPVGHLRVVFGRRPALDAER